MASGEAFYRTYACALCHGSTVVSKMGGVIRSNEGEPGTKPAPKSWVLRDRGGDGNGVWRWAPDVEGVDRHL